MDTIGIYEKVKEICDNKCSAGKSGGGCNIKPSSAGWFIRQGLYQRGWFGNKNYPACKKWESIIPKQ